MAGNDYLSRGNVFTEAGEAERQTKEGEGFTVFASKEAITSPAYF
jgi:hypothetical protein